MVRQWHKRLVSMGWLDLARGGGTKVHAGTQEQHLNHIGSTWKTPCMMRCLALVAACWSACTSQANSCFLSFNLHTTGDPRYGYDTCNKTAEPEIDHQTFKRIDPDQGLRSLVSQCPRWPDQGSIAAKLGTGKWQTADFRLQCIVRSVHRHHRRVFDMIVQSRRWTCSSSCTPSVNRTSFCGLYAGDLFV